tara:strand:- start:30 stop:290 length:261 start_codon:yes stop_codon:yes gene_type:complete
LSKKDEKFGDKTHEFILSPPKFFIFLLILLISKGKFPKLLPKVNLNDGTSAVKKDVYNIVSSNNKKNLTKRNYILLLKINTVFFDV